MPIENTEASFKLQDRTAVITGPCNTVNQSIAFKFTQLGANVALVDKNIDQMQRFAGQLMDAREINERYGRAFAIQADLTKLATVQDGISRAAEAFGGIDIFIDGLMTNEVKPFRDAQGVDELDRMIDVNIRSPMLVTHSILRFLEGRKRGRIIYLMQDLGRMGLANNSLMAMTRTGLTAFARSLAREVAEKNITVNCVAMGPTEEFLLSQNPGEQISIQEAQARIGKSFPFATMTEPEKIANTVAFLASPLGLGITGQTIAVSQGLSFLS
jgi:NAD(P)-dependent dehydrogenase (short-subunit alcohol dehydrogenase family)